MLPIVRTHFTVQQIAELFVQNEVPVRCALKSVMPRLCLFLEDHELGGSLGDGVEAGIRTRQRVGSGRFDGCSEAVRNAVNSKPTSSEGAMRESLHSKKRRRVWLSFIVASA